MHSQFYMKLENITFLFYSWASGRVKDSKVACMSKKVRSFTRKNDITHGILRDGVDTGGE